MGKEGCGYLGWVMFVRGNCGARNTHTYKCTFAILENILLHEISEEEEVEEQEEQEQEEYAEPSLITGHRPVVRLVANNFVNIL